jgi:putative PIN family toxin of toxin-antitoxin system
MIVLLDANVLISAIAGRGLCEAVVEYCLGEHEVVVSDELVQDVREKLLGKIKVPPGVAAEFCQLLLDEGKVVQAGYVSPNACRGPDDLHLLGLAETSSAAFLVSGDKDLLVLGRFKGIRIVTPRQFWDCMRGGGDDEDGGVMSRSKAGG